MKIGDQVLRDLSLRLTQIEEQFDLLEWVDAQFGRDQFQLQDYILELAERLRKVAAAPKVGVFTLLREKWTDFDTAFNADRKITLESINALPAQVQNEAINLADNIAERWCRVFITTRPKTIPEITFVLEDEFFGRRVADFYDEGFLLTARLIADRSSVLIDHHINRRQAEKTNQLTKEFLAPKALDEGKEFSVDELYDTRWTSIVNLFAEYFPPWKPFAFDQLPRVQILTVDDTSNEFIVLRTTHGTRNVAYKPLKRHLTIVGLLLDEEAKRGKQKYLLVDPTDERFIARYASFLFKGQIPRTELVIPIRTGDGSIAALINLEHLDAEAFSSYHLDTAVKAAEFIAPFILCLISEEKEDISADKQFRYVITRLIKKISDSYRHKVSNKAPTIRTALSEIEREFKNKFNRQQLSDFEDVKSGVNELANLSRAFLENLSGYMTYGKVDLGDAVQDAMLEFDAERLKKTDNVDLEVERNNSAQVFGSKLIREHIYNIVKNSLDQFEKRRRDGIKSPGKITITISPENLNDLRGQQRSYQFAKLTIADNAGGIPEEHQDRVLQPGYTTKGSAGHGYGLSAAWDYLLKLGGYLELRNSPGKGLAVDLYFPIFTPGYHEILSKNMNVPNNPES